MSLKGWTVVGFALFLPSGVVFAQAPRVNIYRYVIDVDVPESGALIALDAATSRVVRGSAPKPVAASLIHFFEPAGDWRTGLALDVSPYYLLGGGRRTLESYRKMTVAGRLTRVLTKTTISVAGISDPVSSSLLPALAIRSTFHDPHDPIGGTRLPEEIDSALAAAGLPPLADDEEEATGRGVDLAPLYAAARRTMRARGDVQVSGGWGVAGRWEEGGLGEEPGRPHHTLWLTGQHGRGPLLDILATVQWRDAFHDQGRMRVGLGLQRKGAATDFRLEAHYDWTDGRVHPGVAVESRLAPGLGVVGALLSDPDPSGPARARMSVMVRWYAASER